MKQFETTKDRLAAMAFANTQMILENAIVMPDEYIADAYGSDLEMCRTAEAYLDLGLKALERIPDNFDVVSVTMKSIGPDPEEPDEPVVEIPDPPKKKNAKKPKLDVGKMIACAKAGWSVAKIADELGCSEQTVRNHLKKAREEGKL